MPVIPSREAVSGLLAEPRVSAKRHETESF
jgi:hypothetical protein